MHVHVLHSSKHKHVNFSMYYSSDVPNNITRQTNIRQYRVEKSVAIDNTDQSYNNLEWKIDEHKSFQDSCQPHSQAHCSEVYKCKMLEGATVSKLFSLETMSTYIHNSCLEKSWTRDLLDIVCRNALNLIK